MMTDTPAGSHGPEAPYADPDELDRDEECPSCHQRACLLDPRRVPPGALGLTRAQKLGAALELAGTLGAAMVGFAAVITTVPLVALGWLPAWAVPAILVATPAVMAATLLGRSLRHVPAAVEHWQEATFVRVEHLIEGCPVGCGGCTYCEQLPLGARFDLFGWVDHTRTGGRWLPLVGKLAHNDHGHIVMPAWRPGRWSHNPVDLRRPWHWPAYLHSRTTRRIVDIGTPRLAASAKACDCGHATGEHTLLYGCWHCGCATGEADGSRI